MTSLKTEEATTDASSPNFSLFDLLTLLCYTSQSKFDPEEATRLFREKLDTPLVVVLKKCPLLAISVQDFCGVPFLAKLQSHPRKYTLKSTNTLLFDGTTLLRRNEQPFDPRRGAWYLLLNNSGALLAKSKHLHSQRSHKIPPDVESQPLEVLLREHSLVPTSALPSPTNREEVKAWLEHFGLLGKVYVYYAVGFFKHVTTELWIPGTMVDYQFFKVLAYRDKNNCLSFSSMKKIEEKITLLHEKKAAKRIQSASIGQSDKMFPPPSAFDNNRSSSVSVALQGFTLGVKLGLLSKPEAESLVKQLSLGVLSFWFHFNSEERVCHAFIQDGLGFKQDFEILAMKWKEGEQEEHTEEEYESWKRVFDCIWQRRSALLEYKRGLLEPILRNHAQSPGMRGTVDQYYNDLRAYAHRFKVITFGKGDKCLHALKVYLTHYIFETQGKACRGVTLKTVNQNDVVCLQSKEADFENIAGLFKEDEQSPSKWIDQGEQLAAVFREWTSQEPAQLLLPSPVIEAGQRLFNKQGVPYTPGLVSSLKRESCTNRLYKRGNMLTDTILKLYAEFTAYLMNQFSLDIATVRFISLPSLSFKCLWLNYAEKAGPLHHTLEKTKVFYENQLRQFCKGGFSYSFQDRLASGQPLWPGGSGEDFQAQTVVEYDLKSAYGYSGSKMRAPGGFCVGFTNCNGGVSSNPANKNVLTRTDKMQRVNSFEFMGVMKFVNHFLKRPEHFKIQSVFSNFSALGIFWVGKYPVDLAVVGTALQMSPPREVTYIVQYDGRFNHGCRGSANGPKHTFDAAGCSSGICQPPLNRYCDNKTEAELIEKTSKRDLAIQQWIHEQNSRAGSGRLYMYIVISDCHDVDFIPANLVKQFDTVPELVKFREPYATLFKYSIGISDILGAHPDLTYILVGSGSCPRRSRGSHCQDRPMMVWKTNAETGARYQDFDWNPEGEGLYTRDTLEFAMQHFGFELELVTCVYFYRTDSILPSVFADLVEARRACEQTQQHSKSKFIKSLVNFSTGMFGFNPRKKERSTTSARIIKSLPRRAQAGDYHLHYMGELSYNGYFVAQKINKPPLYAPKQKVLNSALPLYACIVEYGKMRLNSCLRFVLACAEPDSVRAAYSQVDNLVLVLSKPSLEETVAPEMESTFRLEKDSFFTETSCPGKLKKEWEVSAQQDGPWKFVSPRPCSYAVILDQPDDARVKEQCKMSCLNNLSSKQSFDACSRMLDRQTVTFVQERRVNRLLSTATRQVEITFAPK